MTGVLSSLLQQSYDVLSFLRFLSVILSFLPSVLWVVPLLVVVIECHSLISTLSFDIVLVCCKGWATRHRYQDKSVSALFVMISMSHISSVTIMSDWQISFSLQPWLLMEFFIVIAFFIHCPCCQVMARRGKPCWRGRRLGSLAIEICAVPGWGCGFQGRATAFSFPFRILAFVIFFSTWEVSTNCTRQGRSRLHITNCHKFNQDLFIFILYILTFYYYDINI